MKSVRDIVFVCIAALSLALSLFAIFGKRDGGGVSLEQSVVAAADDEGTEKIAGIEGSLESLAQEVADIRMSLGTVDRKAADEAGNGESVEIASIGQRLDSLEGSIANLQSAFDGISLEQVSEERSAQFLAEDGFEKADAYFEAGKYTIAADGYLQFVQAHPDHPDGRNILQRARQAYQRAGYSDMSIWVQEEMMKSFPESRETDLMTLAAMEKSAGRYDEAIQHSAEAAELAGNEQAAIWNRLYWAWYNQLRDGNEAGLEAYRQVQAEIQRAGLEDSKMAERAQEKIDELQKQIAAKR